MVRKYADTEGLTITTSSRQNTLFVAEDWRRVYEALTNVSFQAYSFDDLVTAMRNYIQLTYPEEFSDWISSSEFVAKLEILAWLSQNLAYRVDLNSRENFLAVAERRDSLIRLAQNIAYKVNRVSAASSEVRIQSVQTTQPLTDSNGDAIGQVFWADPQDVDWFEKFITVMNAALSPKTPYGRPLRRFSSNGQTTSVYRFNSLAPATGSYPFSSNVSGTTMPFELVNVDLNPTTGSYTEMAPDPANAYRLLFRTDGNGNSSDGTGFFMPFRQGTTGYQDEFFASALSLRTVDINVPNVNNTDVFVVAVDTNGRNLDVWSPVDAPFTTVATNSNVQTVIPSSPKGVSLSAANVAFTVVPSVVPNVYEILTRTDDMITIRFGDGKFGAIPVGRFRIWYRTSAPVPKIIRSADISNKVVVVPYVSNGVIYNLSITYGLSGTVSNGAPTESNDDIRTRANKVWVTQNRMVTGEDYNSFFLKDNSILKVKTVNRTYSGHGRSVPLNDVTGTYQSVKLVADDGRIYKKESDNFTAVTADPTQLAPKDLVDQFIQPVLLDQDKMTLYFQEYGELPLLFPATFAVDSVVNGQSRGRFLREGVSQPVGLAAAAGDRLFHIGPGCLCRLNGFDGPLVAVDFVVGDGTVNNGVLMFGNVPNGAVVYSVFPPLRQTLSQTETNSLVSAVQLKASFGVRWDQPTETWQIIAFADLDTASPFGVAFAGNTSGSGLDASWTVWLQYQPNSGGADQWVINDRGWSYFFESDREVQFYYANVLPQADPISGRKLFDMVTLLRDNEARDSLLRQNITPIFGDIATAGQQVFVGDGRTTGFPLNDKGLGTNDVYITVAGVIQAPNFAWTLVNQAGPDLIQFVVPPAAGASVVVTVDQKASYATFHLLTASGNGTTQVFDSGFRLVRTHNIIAFVNGLHQSPGQDVISYETSAGNDQLLFSTPPPGAAVVNVYEPVGPGPIFTNLRYEADGVTQAFNGHATVKDVNETLVYINGQLRTPNVDYAIIGTDVDNAVFAFSPTPANGQVVHLCIPLFTGFYDTVRLRYTGDGATATFALPGVSRQTKDQTIAWVNGLQTSLFQYSSLTANDSVTFATPPGVGSSVVLLTFRVAAGADYLNVADITTTDPGLEFEATPTYLGTDVGWQVAGNLFNDDGYTNANGIEVSPTDANQDGVVDDPFMFREFVIQDGKTDLVLWQRMLVLGANVWQPISPTTQVRGTYTSPLFDYQPGEAYDSTQIATGSVHYDVPSATWLVADGNTATWIVAPDQTMFMKQIGRGGLHFQWVHYAPDAHRIDPSPSNIMDTYVLTSGYDQSVRQWITTGSVGSPPLPSTTDQLRVQFQEFDDFKMVSDALIWHPARYKFLFGPQSLPQLQANFLVVRTATSTIPDNDLILQVLAVIDNYFAVGNWDFGDTFYFTELAAFIHTQLTTNIQTVVIVPQAPNTHFGDLFQVMAEPDELFISTATAANVQIVDSLDETQMRVSP